MKRLFAALCLVCFFAAPALAADDKAARTEAAQRYATTFDMPKMMGESINQMALGVPAEHREGFITAMNQMIDIRRLEDFQISIMIELFTTEELNALADFYGAPIGQSILVKMPKMMGALQPYIQNEMMRAVQKLQQQGQKPADGKS